MSFAKSKEGQVLIEPIIEANPINVASLGVCSALAVTVSMKPALVMCLALTFVLTVSNVVVSMIRNYIPNKIRIITYMTVIATMVIIADQFLKTFMYELSLQLSVFVGLIITNCIVMGRSEAFATSNTPWLSLWDGLGNGLGYSFVLMVVSTCRELLGAGKIFGNQVVAQTMYEDVGFINNGLMLLPPGAFIIIGLMIWVTNSLYKKKA